MESTFGVKVDGQLRELRRLLYCGEWIESHALHVYMLHAPDFLGGGRLRAGKSGARNGQERPQTEEDRQRNGQCRRRKGNPSDQRKVGGFYSVPSKMALREIGEQLRWARDAAVETVRWTAKLPFPAFERDYEYVALRHPSEYPLCEVFVPSA